MLSNDIFNKVKTIIETVMSQSYPNLSFTESSKNNIEPTLPCLFIQQVKSPDVGGCVEGKTQVAVKSAFQLEVYSNVSCQQARNIINDAGDIMIHMGYKCIVAPKEMSSDVWRFVARFERIVASGDIIEFS